MLEKKIISTKSTPEIILDPEGRIKISGRSMFENAAEFSEQIEDWIDEYICNPAEMTSVDIYLEYFNIINFKNYYNVLRKIESLKLIDKKYIINWYYEEGDEDILEKGEYISSFLNIPFNYIMISDPLMSESESLEWKIRVA
jgi:hypothetical protein